MERAITTVAQAASLRTPRQPTKLPAVRLRTPIPPGRALTRSIRRLAACATAFALTTLLLPATPLVVGFERFHEQSPDANGGRLLYNELGCVNCHGGDTGLPARRGPALAGITRRINAGWLRTFLAAPAEARTGTTMPHLFAANETDEVNAVVHYLGTLNPKSNAKPKVARQVNSVRGRELFHTVGCVACHPPAPDFKPPEGIPPAADFTHHPVALPRLVEKYPLPWLSEFLRDPLATRPQGRMPHLGLNDVDALDVAAYLLEFTDSDPRLASALEPFKPDPALAQTGRRIVAERNCAACHDLPKDVTAKPVALRNSTGGCLGTAPAPGVPRHELSPAQRTALQLHLTQRNAPITDPQLATLTLEALNCLACHDRDGRGGPDAARKAYFHGDHNLGDTGRYPPPLTGVGRKLQPGWLAQVLAGKARARPYLQARMPVYGEATKVLPALLAKADAKPERAPPAGDIEAGRKLFGVLGGNSCITCHRWGERASLGINGMDLKDLAARIQPGWLHDYLINPAAYRAGTLMPSFWPDGKAANVGVLGGDTAKQIASLYAFAKSGMGEPEGYPANSAGEFELIPTNRPIVLRTFMEGVGTHAIVVGFPQGMHLAYDGLNARPALAWKGRFFDAYNTWFSRFAPFEQPLGEAVVRWPAPPAEAAARFLGYRLDAAGVPTFLWLAGGLRVEERFEPVAGGLRRTLKWSDPAENIRAITHLTGAKVAEEKSSPGRRSFIYTWK